MDQIYYEQIKEYKRKGDFDKCIEIYNNHLNEEEADATFFDGLAKIYMLKGDILNAKKCLLNVHKKVFSFKQRIARGIVNNTLSAEEIWSSFLVKELTLGAMNAYDYYSRALGGDLAQLTRNTLFLDREQLMLSMTEDNNETYLRYIMCCVFEGNIPEGLSLRLISDIKLYKNSILKTFQGCASREEQNEYERVCENFKKGAYGNLFAQIMTVLPNFAHNLLI